MVIPAGTRVGPYEVSALLGAGGMGEVYRARDSRLGRDVAVKVLRSGAVTSQDRLRLEFEARASSRLNHPNILTIYDVGEEDGAPYIVSEFLEGDTLRELIPDNGMPMRRLIEIAAQIADGLAAAHAGQLVHRDLKPENIMVLRDGRVKILDFGLAKPAEEAPANEDTVTRDRMGAVPTAPGMLVGTLGYMSPEQIQGEPLDYRSDQFSFGSVLYEMATGQRPFRRSDRIGTMTAIVREEPVPIQSLNPLVPPPLRWVIDRCLAKQAARRFTSTADLHSQLRDIRDHFTEVVSSEVIASPPAKKGWSKRSLLAAAVLAALGAGFFAAVVMHRHDRNISTYRFLPFATEAIDEGEPAWSPDSQTLAYVGSVKGVTQVFARRVDSSQPSQLTTSATECHRPFWSPEGSLLYYWSSGSIWSIGATGGTPAELIRDVGYWRQPAAVSPDGRTFAFFRHDGSMNRLYLRDARTGKITPFEREPFPTKFRLSGGLSFSPRGDRLLASLVRSIDVSGGSETWIIPWPEGKPYLVAARLHPDYLALIPSWMPDNRHVAFAAEVVPGTGNHLYMLDTAGGGIETITAGTGEEREPAVSPDGKRIAFVNGNLDIDLVELSVETGRVEPLLATARQEYAGDWSHSGRQFSYVSNAGGVPEVWLRRIGESWGSPVVRSDAQGSLGFATPRFSPDDQRLAYVRVGSKHVIWISNLSGGQAVPLEQQSSDQHGPAWSPDGNWIAYARFSNQEWQIAKTPAGGAGQPVRLAAGGTAASVVDWSPSGAWICYTEGGILYALPSSGAPARPVASQIAAFTFAKNQDEVLVLRRAGDGGWQLSRLSVQGGEERRSIRLDLPPGSRFSSMRLHPDGQRLLLSQGSSHRDIWILQGFSPRRGLLNFFSGMPADSE